MDELIVSLSEERAAFHILLTGIRSRKTSFWALSWPFVPDTCFETAFGFVWSSVLACPDSLLHSWEACNQLSKVKVGCKREQNKHVAAAHQVSEGILGAPSAAFEGEKWKRRQWSFHPSSAIQCLCFFSKQPPFCSGINAMHIQQLSVRHRKLSKYKVTHVSNAHSPSRFSEGIQAFKILMWLFVRWNLNWDWFEIWCSSVSARISDVEKN